MKSGLRFDRVARAFLARLQAGLSDVVPKGKTLVVTCTAPIRKDSKTAAELEATVRERLRSANDLDVRVAINENQIGVRVLPCRPRGAPAVIGFVHNPYPGAADVLIGATEAVLAQLTKTA